MPNTRKNKQLVDFADYESLTPMRAIRLKCLDCCGFDDKEVRLCEIKTCALHQFKEKNFKTLQLTDEQRQKRSERFKELMAKQKTQ